MYIYMYVYSILIIISVTLLHFNRKSLIYNAVETHTSDFSLNSPLSNASGAIQRMGSRVFRAEVYSKVSFASPKSHIFSSSLSPTKMFRQARSRWMTSLDIRNSCEVHSIYYLYLSVTILNALYLFDNYISCIYVYKLYNTSILRLSSYRTASFQIHIHGSSFLHSSFLVLTSLICTSTPSHAHTV